MGRNVKMRLSNKWIITGIFLTYRRLHFTDIDNSVGPGLLHGNFSVLLGIFKIQMPQKASNQKNEDETFLNLHSKLSNFILREIAEQSANWRANILAQVLFFPFLISLIWKCWKKWFEHKSIKQLGKKETDPDDRTRDYKGKAI